MKKVVHWFLLPAAATLPTLAFAHAGGSEHAHLGFVAGLLHPFTGADHLAAMLAVGLWSALAVRPVWIAPLAFVLLLAVGAVGGFAGLTVPWVEPMIAASLLVLGLLVATRRGLPLAAAAGLAGGFAFFHGAAHGQELGGDAQALALLGMLISTAALHLCGVGLGHWLQARHRLAGTAAGGAVALLGAALLLRMA